MHAHDTSDLLRRLLGAPSRNHFFYGKRMDVQHFQMEQDYGKHKQWLLNKLTLGKGVLCGLQVSVDDGRVCVDPGVAIDGLGREIVVPVRACIDPAKPHDGCCGEPGVTPAPRPAPAPQPEPGRADLTANVAGASIAADTTHLPGADRERDRNEDGIFTVWLCYRECFTDQQPVLVTDCDTRSHCAPGTVVESFCLKVTPGLPPLQRDPDWCLNWAAGKRPKEVDPAAHRANLAAENAAPSPSPSPTPTPAPAKPGHMLDSTEIREILAERGEKIKHLGANRRHALCELLDQDCGCDDGDPCVPLAAGRMLDGRVTRLEACAVRPRIYSNAVLLDLILCLAERVDACCDKHEPPPPPKPQELLRVASVAFVSRNADGAETPVAEVESPLKEIKLKIKQHVTSIRVKFTADFSQAAPNLPSTHVYTDAEPDRHNVQVRPSEVLQQLEYVPGTLAIEDARTLRFDLFPDSAYARWDATGLGWQKGQYTLLLYGDDDSGAKRHAIVDTGGTALDGEAAAPAGGAMSGDGTAGGTFKLVFTIS